MAAVMDNAAQVFAFYAHENDAHKVAVRELAAGYGRSP
jgi:hypothetical protein